jgi:uncharacterized membrane protein YedE/YeeE
MLIITLGYSFFLFILCLLALFVLYHIFRYSLSRPNALFGSLLFLLVFLFLLGTNVAAFRSLEIEQWQDTFVLPATSSPFGTQRSTPLKIR